MSAFIPAYQHLLQNGDLTKRVTEAYKHLSMCDDCAWECDLNEAWTVGFQYTLVELGNAPVEQRTLFGGTLKGSYDRNDIHAFNFSVRKKF